VADSLRVLVAGWLNSPHVVSWVEAVVAGGHEVHLAGRPMPGSPMTEVPAEMHRLPSGGPPLVRSLRMSRALAGIADAVEPDLVHAHWLPEFGWMAAREGLTPLVCSAWGSDVFGVHGIGRSRSKRALEGSNLVLADSVPLARATRDLAGRDIRVEVMRWGLDLRRFAPGDSLEARSRLGIAHRGPVIASVRGLKPVYNPQLLMEAFASVRSRADAHLLFKFPLESAAKEAEQLKATINQLGISEAVTMLGNLPFERLPDVYRAADVIVSIASSDSSPRSVWEALACGRPVVVSDLPWARDELVPEREALITRIDRDSIAAAIERVLEDRALARRLSAGGRALALSALDQNASIAQIDAVYHSLVGDSSD
jgi:glycosyltransferase involved in cell wall biosynthesis